MNTNSICTSCRHEDYCIHIEHSAENILQCEEFELNLVPKQEIIAEDQPSAKENYSGLCKNCLNRINCMHRNVDSVVWHCEDYEY